MTAGDGILAESLERWLEGRAMTPWPFQRTAWAAFRAGRSGLVHVPTGAGKTYAAYLGALSELVQGDGTPPGLAILYVTPLRAVARDVEKALAAPIVDLALPFSVESRTGDTGSSVRQRQAKRRPTVLVTTPESLTLMLSYPEAASWFADLRCVIVDEWHELLGTKRGTQTELALARLRTLAPALRTWVLSATLTNLEEAAQAAVGMAATPAVVSERMHRPIDVRAMLPERVDRLPWAGHLGLPLLEPLLARLSPERPALIFTNTRAQAERWFREIAARRPAWHGRIGLHHGSIAKEERERIEAGLKSGALWLVVATSSLDLGVDFAPIQEVYQIGSPKSVARLVQRAGRGAHRPNETCRITLVPTQAVELIDVAASRRALDAGRIEPRRPLAKPYDVLAQHLVTCALGGGFRADELLTELRTTMAYAELGEDELGWALDLVQRGGASLVAYPAYRKVIEKDGLYVVEDKRVARLHRMNVGTITADSTMEVRFARGGSLGRVDEAYVSKLAEGDVFTFAGRTLQLVRFDDAVATVRLATGKPSTAPKWTGGRLPLSPSMSEELRAVLGALAAGEVETEEARCLAPLLATQATLSHVPGPQELLAETCVTREGRHLFLYPYEGRAVHEALALLLAVRFSRLQPATFAVSVTDHGLELLSPSLFPFEQALAKEPFTRDGLEEDTAEALNVSALARRQFREIARVAGLVHQSYPGTRKSGRQLQASAGLLYDVFRRFDRGNLLVRQAEREVLEAQFERSRLERTLARMAASTLRLVDVDRPTPFALPLIVERVSARLTTESLEKRIERMRRQWTRS